MTAFARTILIAVLIFLYAPVAIMIMMAFNRSQLYQLPFSFSLRWFQALAQDPVLINAAINSVSLAVATMIIATILGTAAAFALSRRRVVAKPLLLVMLLPPLAIPWLITSTAMLIFFFWSGIGRGLHSILIGHVALAVPYVVLVVSTGLRSVRTDLEEAAMSLGSTPLHAFWSITLPLLLPSVAGAAFFAFAVSLDQFEVAYFLSTPGVTTLPVEIYTSIRKGFTPEINAIATILLGTSALLILAFVRLANPGGLVDRR
jgi:spermidine/putrescine transport system permease protein